MPQFHETGYGRRFFEGQLPRLIDGICEVAKELKRQNELKERELELMKPESPEDIAQEFISHTVEAKEVED